MDVIVTHTMADFDAVASLVAAKKLYPNANMVLPGSVEKNVHDFLVKNKFGFKKEKEIDFKQVKRLIIVDTRLSSRIGELRKVISNPALIIHIYDHHPKTSKDLNGEINLGDRQGATTTLLVDKIKEKKIKITSSEATLFALGIYEDTGCLTFTSTTSDDLKAVSFLLSAGADLAIISTFIHQALSAAQIKLLENLFHAVENIFIEGIKVTIASVNVDFFKEDIAIVIHKLIDLENINILFALIKIKERIHLIARSREKESINVGEIVSFFGGGGHGTAAAATIYNDKLARLKKELLSVIKEKIRGNKGLPIIDVSSTMKLSKARQLFLLRHNCNLFSVTKKNKEIGIITRKDVEKADDYGFGKFPVSTFMCRQIKKGDCFSKCVLKSKEDQSKENIKDIIMGKLPLRVINLLKKIGKLGSEMGYPVYIVGGFVRDLFLNVEDFDIDIVVEGDGVLFAHKLAVFFGKKVIVHNKFSTAVIDFSDEFKIDIATARSEVYKYPGALPEIKSSLIKDDLYRRDFSVNAMAVKINPEGFGNLIDFFNGKEELSNRVVRVLYNLSFIEDPTRIFRAIRFEQRYDFCMDKNTEYFLKWTMDNDFLEKVSKDRIREEMISILNESAPEKVIKRMEQFGIIKYIHPKIKVTKKMWLDFKKINEILFLFTLPLIDDSVEKWLIYFLVLVQDLNACEVEHVCRDFKFNKRWTKSILMAKESSLIIQKNLKNKESIPASFIYLVLHQIPTEVILLTMIGYKGQLIKKRISDYLTEMRHIKIFINGDDLKQMGYKEGRTFRKIKEKLLDAKLDKKVKTMKEEVKFVVDNFPKD